MKERVLVKINGRLNNREKEVMERVWLEVINKGEEEVKVRDWRSLIGDDKDEEKWLMKLVIGVGMMFNFVEGVEEGKKLSSDIIWRWMREDFRYEVWNELNLKEEREVILERIIRYIRECKERYGSLRESIKNIEFYKELNKVYSLEEDKVFKKVILLIMILKDCGYKVGLKVYACVDYNLMSVMEYYRLVKIEKEEDIDKGRERIYVGLRWLIRRYGLNISVVDEKLFYKGRELRREGKSVVRIKKRGEVKY